MKKKTFLALCACGGGAAYMWNASAHHSFAMFDHDTVWTWEGTVVEFQWRQPHTHILVDVPEQGNESFLVGRWDFESSSPNIASRQGWNRNIFKPGDRITIVGNPMLDGTRGGSVKYAVTSDGKVLYHDVNREVTPENTPEENAPRD